MSTSSPPPRNETTSTGKKPSTGSTSDLSPDLQRFLRKWADGARPARPMPYEEIWWLYSEGQISLNYARRLAGLGNPLSGPLPHPTSQEIQTPTEGVKVPQNCSQRAHGASQSGNLGLVVHPDRPASILRDLDKLRAYWVKMTGAPLPQDQLAMTRSDWARVLTWAEYHEAICGCLAPIRTPLTGNLEPPALVPSAEKKQDKESVQALREFWAKAIKAGATEIRKCDDPMTRSVVITAVIPYEHLEEISGYLPHPQDPSFKKDVPPSTALLLPMMGIDVPIPDVNTQEPIPEGVETETVTRWDPWNNVLRSRRVPKLPATDEPDPEMVEYFKGNPAHCIMLPKSYLQQEQEQYIQELRHPVLPTSTSVQNRLEKFLMMWDRAKYSTTTLTDDQVWYLRVAERITFEQALELSPTGRAWAKQECTHTSSPSTAGTTSTSTPESKEPSSSSTSSDLSEQESGPKPSSGSRGVITGCY